MAYIFRIPEANNDCRVSFAGSNAKRASKNRGLVGAGVEMGVEENGVGVVVMSGVDVNPKSVEGGATGVNSPGSRTCTLNEQAESKNTIIIRSTNIFFITDPFSYRLNALILLHVPARSLYLSRIFIHHKY